MNLYQFIQFEKLGHIERESFPIDLKKINLFRRILIKEKDFEIFKLNFKNYAFIVKGNDKKTIDNVNLSTESTLKKMLDYKKGFPFNYQFGQEKGTLIPYYGSKKNRRNEGNEVINYILENDNIEKVCDLFAGAGNLTFDNLFYFHKYNPNMKIIMNDFNIYISSMYYNIQNYVDEVYGEYAKLIFWLKNEFNELNLTTDKQYQKVQQYLLEELKIQSINNDFTPKTTALFIFLQHISRNGKISYDSETKSLEYDSFRNESAPYQCLNFALVVNKIFFYHEVLNIMDIEIVNNDYNNIIKPLLNENVLLLVDSPYADYDAETLKSGGENYQKNVNTEIDFGNNFNQSNLLNYLKIHQERKGSFIYWNNHHKDIQFFSTEHLNTHYIKIPTKYADSNRIKQEIYMYVQYLTIEDIKEFGMIDEDIEEYEYQKSLIKNCEIELNEEDFAELEQAKQNIYYYIDMYKTKNKDLPFQLLKYEKEYNEYKDGLPEF